MTDGERDSGRAAEAEGAAAAVMNGGAENGKPAVRNALFPVGASLYPLDSEEQRPDEWYAHDLTAELDALHRLNCALVRVFVSWRVLEPQVGRYDDDVLERLAAVISAVQSRKMKAIVCFFADDRHSESTEVSWGARRDPRTDAYLIERQVALAGRVTHRLRGEKGVFGWQLGNEAFLSGFTTRDALLAWTEALRDAILEQDPTRPIALGADAETLMRSTGVDARDAVALCDYAVAHVTSAYTAYAAQGPITSGPSTYLDSFLLRLALGDSPVLLDDVGPLVLENSLGEEAAYLRTALWSGFCNRGAGLLVRRFRDMETERREPYFIDPFEALIGIVDHEGEPKPAFGELERFVQTAARIDLEKYPLTAERVAVVMPAERYEPLPDLAGLYAPRACLHAYIAAKRAHLPVAVVREEDEANGHSVIVVPSATRLRDETWDRLAAFVQTGGTLLMSYGGGDAHPKARDVFGCEFLGDDGPRDWVQCRVAQPDLLGALSSFDERFPVHNFARLSAVAATVVATDATGSPLVTINQLGQGRAVFMAAPLERAVAQNDPWATPATIARLLAEVYGAAARAAGCGAPLSCDAPDVEISLFQGDSDDILVLVNHAPKQLTANLEAERIVASISDVRGGEAVTVGGRAFGVPLPPNGIAALKLSYA